jgi:hypothetical protein
MTDIDDFEDEEEWTVEGFLAACDRITNNPPAAPSGFELIECEATPRHWPIYEAYVDGQYPAPCFICERDELDQQLRKVDCERSHRRWKSWRIWWQINMRLYTLGITSSGGGLWMGRCEFCGIERQHMAPCWRGRRPYILGARREFWTCLRRGHRRSPTDYGLCSVCCPCPSCGSTNPSHDGDCGQVAA